MRQGLNDLHDPNGETNQPVFKIIDSVFVHPVQVMASTWPSHIARPGALTLSLDIEH